MARAYRFRLETVRHWRRIQLELEEAKLEALFGELRQLAERRAALEAGKSEAERAVLSAPVVEARELAELDAHRVHVAAETGRLKKLEAGSNARITAQRQALRKAEQNLRLLDKLEERTRAEWQRELRREEETLASESYLAKWGRSREQGPAPQSQKRILP